MAAHPSAVFTLSQSDTTRAFLWSIKSDEFCFFYWFSIQLGKHFSVVASCHDKKSPRDFCMQEGQRLSAQNDSVLFVLKIIVVIFIILFNLHS